MSGIDQLDLRREQAIERSVGKRQDAARRRRNGEKYCAACGGPCMVHPEGEQRGSAKPVEDVARLERIAAFDRSIERAVEDHQAGVHSWLGTGPCPGCPLCPAVAA